MVPRLLATLVAATLTPQAKNSHLESRLMGVEGSSYQPPPHSLDVAVLCAPPICLEEAHSEEWPSCSIMSPAVRPSSHQISRVSKSKNSTRKEVTAALKGAILRQEAEKRSAATELARKKQKKRSPRSQQKESKVALVQGAYGLRGSYGLHGSYGRRRCGEHGKTGKAVAGERTTLNAHWCLGCSGVAGSGDLPWVESAGATQCGILENALEWVNAQGVIA